MDEVPFVHAYPLVEVFSISIHTSCPGGEEQPFEVYGEVFAIDGDGDSLAIYNRDIGYPEIISQGSTLSLTGPGDCSIMAPGAIIGLDLRDKARDGQIAKGVFYVEDLSQNSICGEQVYKKRVDGECGYASVNYIVLPFGVMANVSVEITTEDAHERAPIDVYGSIMARYDKSYGLLSSSIDNNYKKYLRSTLFNLPKSQISQTQWHKENVVRDKEIQLQRSAVSVPAYSSLIIDLDLSDFSSDAKIVDQVEAKFKATHGESDVKQQVGKLYIDGQKLIIQVNVHWQHAYHVSLGSDDMEDNENERLVSLKKSSASKQAFARGCISRGIYPFTWLLAKTEIWSVYIGRHNFEHLNLFGTIKVTDGSDTSYPIFERDEDDPEILLPSNTTIPIVGPPRSFLGIPLIMDVNLKDLSGNFSVKGSIVWDEENMQDSISWFNLFIRSIVQGIGGYVAVSYSIIDHASDAFMKVSFVSKKSTIDSAKIYGSVIASYGGILFSSRDQMEFCRSILFMKGFENSIEILSGSQIPLLKSVIPVPENDKPLTIHVNLFDIVSGGSIKGAASCHIGSSTMIHGQDYAIEVSIKSLEM